METTERFRALEAWYRGLYPKDADPLVMVSGDASFRKFYRCRQGR